MDGSGLPPRSLPPRAWNDTATRYPRDRTLHELFDARARSRPDAPAAVHGSERLAYGELRARADALAARLRASGVRPGDRVGVRGGRSLAALVALVGTLRAGAAYVPIDDSLPPARVAAMVEDAGVQVLVEVGPAGRRLRGIRATVPVPGAESCPERGDAAWEAGTLATDCAYVMFTSGSTGRPKAVAVPHRGVVRLAVSDRTLSVPGPEDRIAHTCGLSSDASTIEIWSALLNGACLVLVDQQDLLSPPGLERVLRRQGVTIAYLTTGVFHLVARSRPGALRTLRFASAGGEAMDPDLARAVLAACPDLTVVNFYGPTENSVVSTAHVVRAVEPGATSVPIGRPFANSTCLVLRDDGQPAAVGEPGELLVGGDGVTLGYLGNAELTRQRFVGHPALPDSPLYRTGDRARWRADGVLEHLGRQDRQVKLRGHRIEPEEVEARLRAHERVGEAVVLLDQRDGPAAGNDALVACVTPASPGRPLPLAEIRAYLTEWLPAQAVPARLVPFDRFPLSASGKVDQQRLRTRLAEAEHRADEAPAGATPGLAGTLAEVWRHTLGGSPGPQDNFFDLGGDSLLAAEVVTRTLAVLGIPADEGSGLVRQLLQNPTLGGFTAAVAAVRSGEASGAADAGAPPDFAAEARLGWTLPERRGPEPRWHAPRAVLLTGASGFLGAFLLQTLLRRTKARVHLPVRARDADHARERVLANLARYRVPPPADPDRLVCFPADLGAPGLGLSAPHAERLAAELDLVLHSGAQVNFLYPYAQLRAVNVEGTRELMRLAAPRRVPVHFLSTVASLAGFGTAGVRRVREDQPLQYADHLTLGYAESKWVAERIVLEAGERGLPVAVYRPYEITGERHSGVCNTDTAICSLFKTIAETGVAPDIALPLDFVPVDYVAEAVVHIATRREPATRRAYHLTNPSPAKFGDMLERMRAAGFRIRTLPYQQWVGELVRHVSDNPSSPTAPFVSMCVDRSRGGEMSVKEMFFEGTFPELARDNRDRDLAGSGLVCPPVDTALLDRYLEYLFSSGYLARPGRAA